MQTGTIEAMCRPLGDLLQRTVILPLIRRRYHLAVHGTSGNQTLPAPCIFAANHSSHLDSPAVLAALPGSRRRQTRVAAAADYWYGSPVQRVLASVVNAFPFPRKGPAGILRAAALLRAGSSVLLYPAGTRDQGSGFQPGVGLLACRTGYPIVPVAILGSDAIWPKGRWFPRRGKLVVSFGTPLYFGPHTSLEEATSRIEAAVRALAVDEVGDGSQLVVDRTVPRSQPVSRFWTFVSGSTQGALR